MLSIADPRILWTKFGAMRRHDHLFRQFLKGTTKLYACAVGYWMVAPYGWRDPKPPKIVRTRTSQDFA